jgi:hypothetical protein
VRRTDLFCPRRRGYSAFPTILMMGTRESVAPLQLPRGGEAVYNPAHPFVCEASR